MEMVPIDSQGSLRQRALDEYAVSLKSLDAVKSRKKLRAEWVLSILVARDEVQRSIAAEDHERSIAEVRRLIELDDRLRKGAGRMVRGVGIRQLERWRSTVNPAETAWWWWLERVVADHPLNRLDGVWRLMMVAGWTANVTLMVNLAARFLGGGVGLAGVAAIAVPSVLGLLQVGSEFTKSGKEGFDRFLGMIRVPSQWREEMKLVITLGVLGGLCVLWLQLPEFSKLESRSGVKSYQEGKLGDAEQSFLKAIALDAENVDAHYNLGSLYDYLEQPEKAKKEYLIAIAGNVPDAYNNLARLYIKEKKYPQAAALLIQGMSTQEKLESMTSGRSSTIEAQTRYSLAKNLGWVRLEQKREEEAQEWVKVAIGIAESTEGVKGSINSGVAHCLLAQRHVRRLKYGDDTTKLPKSHDVDRCGMSLEPIFASLCECGRIVDCNGGAG